MIDKKGQMRFWREFSREMSRELSYEISCEIHQSGSHYSCNKPLRFILTVASRVIILRAQPMHDSPEYRPLPISAAAISRRHCLLEEHR